MTQAVYFFLLLFCGLYGALKLVCLFYSGMLNILRREKNRSQCAKSKTKTQGTSSCLISVKTK